MRNTKQFQKEQLEAYLTRDVETVIKFYEKWNVEHAKTKGFIEGDINRWIAMSSRVPSRSKKVAIDWLVSHNYEKKSNNYWVWSGK